jgi:xanthine dehydrogenase accessory factor
VIAGKLARRAEDLIADRVPFVHATVVRALHPTSVRPGDSALVLADGTIEGFVGGVCAQASVRVHANRALETSEPLLLRIVPGGGGSGDERAADGAVVVHNPCLSGGSLEIFLEPRVPAARMVVVGDAPIARAIRELAAAAGYQVVGEEPGAVAPRAEDAAVVVASHGDAEEPVLQQALEAGVAYVALVSSRVRGEAVRASLDVSDELRERLHAPAGLAIGARSPAEIAIAILAEIVSERNAQPVRKPLAVVAAAPSATAVDPVCGMEVLVAATTPQLELDGERVYFCCEGCRATYAAQHA